MCNRDSQTISMNKTPPHLHLFCILQRVHSWLEVDWRTSSELQCPETRIGRFGRLKWLHWTYTTTNLSVGYLELVHVLWQHFFPVPSLDVVFNSAQLSLIAVNELADAVQYCGQRRPPIVRRRRRESIADDAVCGRITQRAWIQDCGRWAGWFSRAVYLDLKISATYL